MTRDIDEQALDKYREFNRLEPTKVGELPFTLPAEVLCIGEAVHVMYRSRKVDPATLRRPRAPLNYIHDHDSGVGVFVPESIAWVRGKPRSRHMVAWAESGGSLERVPDWIMEAPALVKLGDCLGFRFRASALEDDDNEVDVEGRRPLPELYCTPCGHALVVVQSKREVLAMFWGGMLRVEDRGIVG